MEMEMLIVIKKSCIFIVESVSECVNQWVTKLSDSHQSVS